jgi:CTP:molybdopterin cytidylyltransferase MocA
MTPGTERPTAAGLLLAAGAGHRMGTPKALLRDEGGEPWLVRAVRALSEGGCAPVVVVLGAAYDEAERLVPAHAEVVRARNWTIGMGESLRAGLSHLTDADRHIVIDALVVTLVDLPDVDAAVVRRVVQAWRRHDRPADALVRASYDGRPGHPVVLGREHWPALLASLEGDVGAQHYLTREDIRRSVENVECADLASGHDVDVPGPGGVR